MEKLFLLLIDTYTKWLEVYITSTTTTAATVESLHKSFSMFGIPEVVVSDNTTVLLVKNSCRLMESSMFVPIIVHHTVLLDCNQLS